MRGINNWFSFAREDLAMARTALKERIYNQVCFHSQQGAEKMLKGFLKEKKQNVPRSHRLKELLGLCADIDVKFKTLKNKCVSLDRYYILTRYPDALPGTLLEGMPGKDDAEEALSVLEEVMDFVWGKV